MASKKRGRTSASQDDELEPPKHKPMQGFVIDLELTIGDLFNQTEIDEMKASWQLSKTNIRNEAIQTATRYWNQYARYRKLASETPQVLLDMSREEMISSFLGSHQVIYNSDQYQTLPHMLLQHLSYHLARDLSVKYRNVEMLVFIATQLDVRQPLVSAEELVDECIAKCGTADAFDGAWAVKAFVVKCRSFVKGGGKFNWCKGLIPFLCHHLTWKTNPECEQWIVMLERIISKQQNGFAPYDGNPIFTRLNDAFEMKDLNSKAFGIVENEKKHLNAGRWIRIE